MQFGNSIIIFIFIRRVLGCVPQNPSFSKENYGVLTSSARISLISQRLHLLDLHSSFWCNPILLNLPIQQSTAVPSIKKPSARYGHHSAILRRTRRLPHPRHSVLRFSTSAVPFVVHHGRLRITFYRRSLVPRNPQQITLATLRNGRLRSPRHQVEGHQV